ncbi:hypothetical protein D5086_007716 [Populus alba]|uniref:Uncharacterized protein n=1 Tax=Populus alba TaxID=43335 RepID=A0ACC4CEU5_POPAL
METPLLQVHSALVAARLSLQARLVSPDYIPDLLIPIPELWVLLDLHTFTVIGTDLHGRQEGIDKLGPIRACGQTVMPED